jgi:hypothetical protein
MEARKAFLLRIDPALWAELEGWAQDELRSVNGQVEYVLRQAVQKRKGPASSPSSAARSESARALPPAVEEPPTSPDRTAADRTPTGLQLDKED